jgi:hypothetical protein
MKTAGEWNTKPWSLRRVAEFYTRATVGFAWAMAMLALLLLLLPAEVSWWALTTGYVLVMHGLHLTLPDGRGLA